MKIYTKKSYNYSKKNETKEQEEDAIIVCNKSKYNWSRLRISRSVSRQIISETGKIKQETLKETDIANKMYYVWKLKQWQRESWYMCYMQEHIQIYVPTLRYTYALEN